MNTCFAMGTTECFDIIQTIPSPSIYYLSSSFPLSILAPLFFSSFFFLPIPRPPLLPSSFAPASARIGSEKLVYTGFAFQPSRTPVNPRENVISRRNRRRVRAHTLHARWPYLILRQVRRAYWVLLLACTLFRRNHIVRWRDHGLLRSAPVV